jgi:putative endopeptidase
MRRIALAAALLLSTAAVAATSAPPRPAAPAATGHALGVDLTGIDRNTAPGDDFDLYANGAWRTATQIPPDRTSLGAFQVVGEVVDRRNAEIIEGAGRANPRAGTDQRKIADYYAAYLDTAQLDRTGLAPVQAHFRRIDAIANVHDLSTALGMSLRTDVDPLNATNFWTENLFGLFVTQGLNDPTHTMPYLLQGGLGMPDRDYYLSDEPGMVRIRDAYRTYVRAMLTRLGFEDANSRADRIIALEMKIARAQVGAVDAQEPSRAQTWSRADFARRAPGIDWDAFFTAAEMPRQQSFIAWHPQPIAALSALVASEPLAAWKDWMMFHLASRSASVLPHDVDDLRFSFYGRVLSGAQQQRPRERRALAATSGALGDAVGRIYVARYFPATARADVQRMVQNIINAFDRRLSGLTWMTPQTRAEARAKVRGIVVGVGYPDRWRDYSTLEVRRDDAFGNAWRAGLYEYRHQLAKIGRPVDRREWWMNAQTVNAVNMPLQNAISFPAAILEPPFYDASADPAFNYGSIGSVIGHEISHSFDNLGAGFDAQGRLRNWWTPADLAHFTAAGQALSRQYDTYSPFPGVHVNGNLTLGENIADLAGLAAAYDAYHASLGGRPAPVINGLTGDQRFFLAYAQSRRETTREAALRGLIATNEHAPGRYRAETVRNLDAWYSAFNVQQGQRLFLTPAQRVRIW